MKLAVVNTKGGTGKTTTAMHLAAGLFEQKPYGRTLLIDADPQQSATRWSQAEPLMFPVVGRASNDIHRTLPQLGHGFDHVIVDTPPGDLGIIRSAVMAVDTVIVPVAPTGLDLNRIAPTWELLAEIEPIHPVGVGVLLTKVRRGTVAAREIRGVLEEIGYPILDTEIPLAEQFAAAFGSMPTDLGRYDDLLQELKS